MEGESCSGLILEQQMWATKQWLSSITSRQPHAIAAGTPVQGMSLFILAFFNPRYSRGGLLESAFYMQVANALLPPLGESGRGCNARSCMVGPRTAAAAHGMPAMASLVPTEHGTLCNVPESCICKPSLCEAVPLPTPPCSHALRPGGPGVQPAHLTVRQDAGAWARLP